MKGNPMVRLKRFDAAGFTLIEMSVVVALLIGLLTVVFLGLGFHQEGADKAKCRLQLAAVQKAVRCHANFNNLRVTDPLPPNTVMFGGAAPVIEVPTCPAGGLYTWQTTVPEIGVPYGDCSGTTPGHTLAGTVDGW